MEKEKYYRNCKFNGKVISDALKILTDNLKARPFKSDYNSSTLKVETGDTAWYFDNDSEFFSDYKNSSVTGAYFRKVLGDTQLSVHLINRNTIVKINAEARSTIEAVSNIFDSNLENSKLPTPPKEKPTIFIGHGKNQSWKDLKDHLHEKHGYAVEAYEIGARAGHEIRDILESMLSKSTFALLVMTGENKGNKGKIYARDNVIHELGLFQGRLGFNKVIVLLENGVEEFSNIKGITQIRFKKGNIKETYGDVLATLNREVSSD